jgi:PAS domain S-box-containing protein
VDHPLVQHMVNVIERSYADSLTLRGLSANVGRQPAYLGRLFREETGATVREYVTHVRMAHAADLIRQGVKIEAVALGVGYRSKKNFYQRFLKEYGTTPLRYRHQDDPGAGLQRDHPCPPPRREPTTTGAADASRRRDEDVIASDPEPILASLGSIVRGWNRARHRAVQAQQLMLKQCKGLCLSMLFTNDEGRYIAANRAAVAATGYTPAELSQLSPTDLFESTRTVEIRRALHFLMVKPRRHQRPNATLRTKSGDAIAVHLVTIRNLLWERSEMSVMLAGLSLAE